MPFLAFGSLGGRLPSLPATLAICLGLYVMCGTMGYLRFGPHVLGDVLKNYAPGDPAAGVARVAIGFTATFSFPISAYNGRLGLQSLVFANRPFSNLKHYGITFVWVAIALGVALVVRSITDVFALVGSTGAVMFMFIYPALFGWHLFAEQKPWTRAIWIGVLILSAFVGISSLTVTIKGFIEHPAASSSSSAAASSSASSAAEASLSMLASMARAIVPF